MSDRSGESTEPAARSAVVADPIGPGSRVDSYRIVEPIGEGGWGVVFLAEHLGLERRVALKVLRAERDPITVERFFDEARAVNRIGHEHIVEATDFGTAPSGEAYFVMELLVGETLAARLAREGSWPLDRAVRVALQIADALSAAHALGIVHRDLKPANVFLIRRDGNRDYVKLLDFGIAKRIGPAAREQPYHTRDGAVLGTPHYMSPEQAHGRHDVDARTDVYALGVLLFELTSGRVPFVGETYLEVLKQQDDAPFPSVRELRPELPARFEALLFRATAKAREERFPTMAALREALLQLLDSDGASTLPANTQASSGGARTLRAASGSKPRPGRRGWIIGLALMATAAAATATTIVLRQGRTTGEPERSPTAAPIRELANTPPPPTEPPPPIAPTALVPHLDAGSDALIDGVVANHAPLPDRPLAVTSKRATPRRATKARPALPGKGPAVVPKREPRPAADDEVLDPN